jgi:hypothetical protein
MQGRRRKVQSRLNYIGNGNLEAIVSLTLVDLYNIRAPFNAFDNFAIESTFQQSTSCTKETDGLVLVFYDKLHEVNVPKRSIYAIYWEGESRSM